MSGLVTHHGSVLTAGTSAALDLEHASYFLAMTDNDEVNALATREASSILGRRQIFQLAPGRPEHRLWWQHTVGTFARPLFSRETTYADLQQRLDDGWTVTATRLTQQFDNLAYIRRHPEALPFFIVDAKGRIDILAGDAPRRARVDEVIVALVAPDPGR